VGRRLVGAQPQAPSWGGLLACVRALCGAPAGRRGARRRAASWRPASARRRRWAPRSTAWPTSRPRAPSATGASSRTCSRRAPCSRPTRTRSATHAASGALCCSAWQRPGPRWRRIGRPLQQRPPRRAPARVPRQQLRPQVAPSQDSLIAGAASGRAPLRRLLGRRQPPGCRATSCPSFAVHAHASALRVHALPAASLWTLSCCACLPMRRVHCVRHVSGRPAHDKPHHRCCARVHLWTRAGRCAATGTCRGHRWRPRI